MLGKELAPRAGAFGQPDTSASHGPSNVKNISASARLHPGQIERVAFTGDAMTRWKLTYLLIM